MNKKMRNTIILIFMVSFLGFSPALTKGDVLCVDVEITIKQIIFGHVYNDGDIVGPGEIGFKVTAIGGANEYTYYGQLGKGTHTISGISFFFERYLPYAYFTIEIWDKDGSDPLKDLVFRARLEVGNSGVATYDYNGLYTHAWYCPDCPGWVCFSNDDNYPLIQDFFTFDEEEVEHSGITGTIPKMTIDVDLTYYYADPF